MIAAWLLFAGQSFAGEVAANTSQLDFGLNYEEPEPVLTPEEAGEARLRADLIACDARLRFGTVFWKEELAEFKRIVRLLGGPRAAGVPKANLVGYKIMGLKAEIEAAYGRYALKIMFDEEVDEEKFVEHIQGLARKGQRALKRYYRRAGFTQDETP